MPAIRLFEMPEETAAVAPWRANSCISCGLFKHAVSPRMEPQGENRRKLMVIGEAPGKDEDRIGSPWQGEHGLLLRRTLRRFGVDLDRDCVSLNSVNCRTPDSRAPNPHELMCCRGRFVQPAIQREKPRVILLLGGAATVSVAGSLMSDIDQRITKWRGFKIPIPEWGCWLCPTFHPSFVAKSSDKREVETVWERDLEAAIAQLSEDIPQVEDLRRKVVILTDEESVLGALSRVSRGMSFSHDYETTGLKAIVQNLVSASWATDTDRSFAFMCDSSERVQTAWGNILADDGIKKIAHNIKFENEWGLEYFDVDRIEWEWDSMIGAHVVDNRPGICGLKVQSFLQFGIPDYGKLIGPFLESVDKKDIRAPNRIFEFIERYGAREELIYNGIDSLVGLRLARQQMEILSR